MGQLYALMDCNSFYASCERVFRPELNNRPIVVLSNNDGCIVSLTPEAKAVGIPMGKPLFEAQELINKHKVSVFSSNYTLYGDLSARVMSLLSHFSPELEIYSIDEAFLDFTTLTHYNLVDYSHHIRNIVQKQTGIPISIGIGPTKVLAKLANAIVKKNRHIGVFSLEDAEIREKILQDFPVEKIWGIGRNSAPKLYEIGIRTAKQFRDFDNDKLIQKILTKTGRKIQEELRGTSCIELTEMDNKKVIASTRGFGKQVFAKEEIKEAVANYITVAVDKLRTQNNVCLALSVYIRTGQFNEKYYCGQGSVSFNSGTGNPFQLIKAGHKIVDDIFKPGFAYKKAGIFLSDIVPANESQLDLMSYLEPQADNKILSLMDSINKRFGKSTIRSAACGTTSPWKMLSEHRSPCYTTNWKELAKVK